MKPIFVLLAVVATAYAALPSSEYLPPLEDASPTSNLDLQSLGDSGALADDGYRYKTVKRLRLRHRRDVSELPSNEYLPPQEAPVADIPVVVDAPVEAEQETAVLADDGYRYKTVKRIRYRHRRDVSELPSNEYLPPVQETAVVEEAAPALVAQEESAVLADDGYRYKTVRRLRFRRRRDVNELPSNEYLPPVQETAVVEEAAPVAAAPAVEESAVLADDGYRYKTVRRLRFRRRRDVNELPSNEYLPPTQEVAVVEEAAPAVVAQEETAVLADDGYRYKTVRRLRFRRRRDVNELPSNEYLPPVQEAAVVEEAAPAVEESAVLADDGYRYKTVRRLRFRRRRDVNELPSNEYLPPVQEAAVVEEAAPVVAAPVVEESAVLADDGYRYKTVRRLRFRRRRDVNELPSNEYLPPVQEAAVVEEAAPVVAAPAVEESAVLADDGYRYKTVRRLRFRRRRDVNELPSNEYLPPAQEAAVVEEAAPVVAAPAVEESAVLADDGYRYKTVKRLRFRRRRDVNELPSNEYLPPTQEATVVEEAAPVVESAPLADDGYRYKTVKRVVYRRRF